MSTLFCYLDASNKGKIMDGWDERMSQPPEVNRCPICGITDNCPGHDELEILVHRLDKQAHELHDSIIDMQKTVERMRGK